MDSPTYSNEEFTEAPLVESDRFLVEEGISDPNISNSGLGIVYFEDGNVNTRSYVIKIRELES